MRRKRDNDDDEFIVLLDLGTGFDQHGKDLSRQRRQNVCHSYSLRDWVEWCIVKCLPRGNAARVIEAAQHAAPYGQPNLAQSARPQFDRDQAALESPENLLFSGSCEESSPARPTRRSDGRVLAFIRP